MPASPPVHFEAGVMLAVLISIWQVFVATRSWLRRRARKRTGRRGSPRQPLVVSARSVLRKQGILGLLLWVSYLAGAWTPASVGVSPDVSPATALLFGTFVYYGYRMCLGAALVVLRVDTVPYSRAALRVTASLSPMTRSKRILMMAVVAATNPITEELVFRGLLVRQLAIVSGSPWGLLGALVLSMP